MLSLFTHQTKIDSCLFFVLNFVVQHELKFIHSLAQDVKSRKEPLPRLGKDRTEQVRTVSPHVGV